MSNRALVRLVLVVALALVPTRLVGQEARTVAGQVIAEESMQPVAGANVTVTGTNTGMLTDSEGRFTLQVSSDATSLTVSFLGYRTQEVSLEGVTGPIEVSLSQQAIGLEGIVVTALGVQREKRSLGYSMQELRGDAVSEVPKLNIVNAMKGNVAGVQITDAGPMGGSSRIVIRGANSISGNNQPLFVVDGVPIDNSSPTNDGYGGIDYGNLAQDVDLNDVESISVLKGPNAAALYGARAQNGAIVITTKSGGAASGSSLGMSATVSMTAQRPLRLPKYQNLYGQGVSGEYAFVDGAGGGTHDAVDESWGPRLDGRLIDQFTGEQQPWVPQPDNIRNFFDTGRTLDTHVSISRSGENSNLRFSVGNQNSQGMFPGSEVNRLNVALRGGARLSDRFNVDGALNYISRNSENLSGTGYDEDNPMQQFIWFGRQVDMERLRDYECSSAKPTSCDEGGQFNWNYNYHNNPFWEQYVNGNDAGRDRLIGHLSSGYQFTEWLDVRAQVGRDWSRERRKNWVHHYSLDDDGEGSFTEDNLYRIETNAELTANATRTLSPDLQLSAMAGGNVRRNEYEQSGVTVDRLAFPGIFTVANAAVTPEAEDFQSVHEVRSLYGSLNLNYRDYLNFDVTGRNDWSSTLPAGNNSYFYPSVSSAFVFSDAFGISSDVFSSGKIRASWARVGNDTDPYRLRSVLNSQQGWDGVPMFAVPDSIANPDLKPEETTSIDIGADLGFFNERLGFVLTYYDARTKNQILPVQISRASGSTHQILNAGEIRNYGTELSLVANPIRKGGFRWDVNVNWSKNNSQVRELTDDVETYVMGTYWSLDVEARGPRRDADGNVVEYYGQGTLFGNPYLRDDQGRLLLNEKGLPQADPERRVLGNYNPDWQGGIQNRFSYGPAELSVLIDGQKGGNVFSVTDYFGEYAGVLESSLRGRENDFCDPGIVVEGVLPDGSMNGENGNEVSVCPETYFGNNFGIHESAIKDASYIKLREVRLGYRLPDNIVGRLGFASGSVALIGRNLAIWSETENIDPETAFDASNVQGVEFGQHPTARSIGISFTVRP